MSASGQQHQFVSEWADGPYTPATISSVYQRRALLIWPGLDHGRLGRTHGDPWKIARLVAQRSSLPTESILALLMGVRLTPDVPPAGAAETVPKPSSSMGR